MHSVQGQPWQPIATSYRPQTKLLSDRFTHSSSRRHEVPQAPQFLELVCRLTHPPAQSVVPGAQASVDGAQPPSLQICVPAEQVFPQETQLNGSEVVSLHVGTPPPAGMQRLRPGRQTQVPLMHAWSAAHWMPHPPQFWGSLLLSTHVFPAQTAAGAGQVQAPSWHRKPGPQAMPQPLQCFGSAFRSAQVLVLEPGTGQLVKPPGQRQTPCEHEPVLHELVHTPQWNGSDCRSEQVPPHCCVGGSHCCTHRPW